ncbi:MAG: hypothetical protein ABIQ01_05740 [Pseudolysinimonas sp.]
MRDSNDPKELLADAIERLTREHTETAVVAGEVKKHFTRHPALMAQLRTAIGGNVGGSGTGGKPAYERTPIDPDALQKYLSLVNDVQEFYFEWMGERVPDVGARPEGTLAAAYLGFKRQIELGTVPDEFVKKVARHWEGRCLAIEEKLSPATMLDLPGNPCPECGMVWFDRVLNRSQSKLDPVSKQWIDVERQGALQVVYRADDLGSLSKSYVKCGCCETVWAGDHGIRFVANELERYEQRARAEFMPKTSFAETFDALSVEQKAPLLEAARLEILANEQVPA